MLIAKIALILVPSTFVVAACSPAPDPGSGESGGSGGAAGKPADPGTGASTGTNNVPITPSDTGWVEAVDNELGIQGSWYPYGDRYGAAKCMNVGLHALDECSLVTAPEPPPAMGFPNQGGMLCTTGETAVILPCMPGVTTSGCPTSDYSNMWGAGIGFDFNANEGAPDGDGAKHTWNPADHGVTGISFELDKVPPPGFRVEFPMVLLDSEAMLVSLPSGATTDDHPDGAPYWGANSSFGNSPVVVSPQVNVVRWDAVKKPGTATTYVFDKARLLGIQFHVPAVKTAPRGAYGFCISKLTFLRD